METGQWLSAGDEIELEIAGVGTLRNVIGGPGESGGSGTPART
jgi:2-keto-4-pentenoate hydratase/2-oxohepta-3-ene-1,7-dioic acid hydratase in catechol pathway